MLDQTTEALVILFAAVVVAIGGGAVQCQQMHDCVAMKTCAYTSTGAWMGFSCSFSNYVDLAGDRAYGLTTDTFVSVRQGVCAPGERMNVAGDMTSSTCAAHYTYPNAYSDEITDPSAVEEHDKACGKWIDAIPWPTKVESFSLYDDSRFRASVKEAEAGLIANKMAFTDMGKFYASCEQTASVGTTAIRTSAIEAYNHLHSGLYTNNYTAAMQSLGFLAAHACDGPVQLGTSVTGGGFKVTATRGTDFAPGILAKALFALQESTQVQEAAEAANKYVSDYAFSSPEVTVADYEHIFNGAAARNDLRDFSLSYTVTPELDGFVLLAVNHLPGASAYLKGVAALCAANLWGNLAVVPGGLTDTGYALRPKNPSGKQPVALGRLGAPEPGYALLTNETLLEASVVTFGQLRARPVGNPPADCAALTRTLFPDRLDHLRFSMIVPDKLNTRIEAMVVDLKQHVMDVLTLDTNVQGLNVDTSTVVNHINHTLFRIPGAPRGSWSGIQRELVQAHISSDTGPLKIALLQANALFKDRVNLAYDDLNQCAGPPMYDALETNGYIYPGASECSHVLLGMMRRPWADVRYDDTSLYTRVGFVFAHELAHHTIASKPFAEAVLDPLVSEYPESQHEEAIADIVAALAVIRSGKVTPTQLCAHQSQVWCARTPPGYTPPSGLSHPPANERGDKLCRTLRNMGVLRDWPQINARSG